MNQNLENQNVAQKPTTITREEWLRHAVDMIDCDIFHGELKSGEIDYQIACGWCKSKKALGETVFPPVDDENPDLDDFFPVTIHMSVTEKEPLTMVIALVHECIHAFFNIKNHGKNFKKKAHEVGFGDPVTHFHPTEWLENDCKNILRKLVEKYGEFPGKPLTGKKKEKKERKKSIYKLFCPNCGFECKAKKDDVEKFGRPTCACGGLMALDLENDSDGESEGAES